MRTFWRLLSFLRPYRSGVVWSFVFAAGAIGATVLIPFLTGRAINSISGKDKHELATWAILISLAGLGRLVLSVFRRLVAGRVSLAVEVDLRTRLYGQLQRLELAFFDRQQTGQLMSRATVDLQSVRWFLGYGLVFIAQSLLSILLAAVAMFILRPDLAAMALAPVPLVVLIAWRYGKYARPALQEAQQRIAELTADAEENISGIRVVKAFAQEERQLKRFGHSVGRVFDQQMTATRIQARYTPIISFLPNLGLAVILLVGGRYVIDKSLTLGAFTAFYAYVLMLISPMRTLGYMLSAAQRATASGARIFEVLDREPRMTVPEDAPGLPAGRGEVHFDGAGLRFEGSGRPALHDIDLEIEAGETVALVGAMGSGKTALVSLIPRLYDVTAGSVRIDGADVRDVDPTSLRQQIAVVTDDPFLFSATVHENIAYGRPEATRDEVEAAARAAQADRFIRALPNGYETLVGERGLTLSGGQRQRIAIARAIAANPRILILDDATSSVDASTEQEIKVALREVMAGRTTFIVAHRLSTIALADEIIVLEEGTVAARGSHEQLLNESALYRQIVEKGMPDQVFLNRKPLEAQVAGL
ncbi:MAG TPA: ABC transporter ATP-binding protein [Solirubrobacteraceae bacterium]|nr:ABC transporter ATP-binding protein [Solirubrobacteraceae bacterium]